MALDWLRLPDAEISLLDDNSYLGGQGYGWISFLNPIYASPPIRIGAENLVPEYPRAWLENIDYLVTNPFSVPGAWDILAFDAYVDAENILPDFDVDTYAHLQAQNYNWLIDRLIISTIYVGSEVKLPDHSWIFRETTAYEQPQDYGWLSWITECRPIGILALTFIDYSRSLSMDELPGTMDSLLGTMDGLGATRAAQPTRLLGMTNGDIWQEDPTTLLDNGQPFTVQLNSKVFTVPNLDATFGEIRLNFKILIAPVDNTGQITLNYSKNDGATWQYAKTVKVPATSIGIPVLIRSRKLINSRRLMWQAVSSNVKFDMTGYEVHEYPGGESKD